MRIFGDDFGILPSMLIVRVLYIFGGDMDQEIGIIAGRNSSLGLGVFELKI
jgi:hypothetical protein